MAKRERNHAPPAINVERATGDREHGASNGTVRQHERLRADITTTHCVPVPRRRARGPQLTVHRQPAAGGAREYGADMLPNRASVSSFSAASMLSQAMSGALLPRRRRERARLLAHGATTRAPARAARTPAVIDASYPALASLCLQCRHLRLASACKACRRLADHAPLTGSSRHWFYEDFVRPESAIVLPAFSLKNFALTMFRACPLLEDVSAAPAAPPARC